MKSKYSYGMFEFLYHDSFFYYGFCRSCNYTTNTYKFKDEARSAIVKHCKKQMHTVKNVIDEPVVKDQV